MKHNLSTCVKSALLAMTLTATSAVPLTAAAEGSLSIYHWFEYIPQELLDKFSEEHDIKVTMDTYDSNESMLAALKAGKVGSYDVAVPGDYMVEIMRNEGMLDEFEPSELSNFGNIEQQWVDVDFDPGRKHSIPYQWGSTSFMETGMSTRKTSALLTSYFPRPNLCPGKSTYSIARASYWQWHPCTSVYRSVHKTGISLKRLTPCCRKRSHIGHPSIVMVQRMFWFPAMLQ